MFKRRNIEHPTLNVESRRNKSLKLEAKIWNVEGIKLWTMVYGLWSMVYLPTPAAISTKICTLMQFAYFCSANYLYANIIIKI